MSTAEVVESYHQLMKVERAFKVLKSLIKVRPVYHHRDRRGDPHLHLLPGL